MPDEIAPQTATATADQTTAASATVKSVEATPVPEPFEQPAVTAESAPAPSSEAPVQTTVSGSGPELVPKVVEELKHVRKRAQEAERRAAYLEGQLEETRKVQSTTPSVKPAQPDPSFVLKQPDISDYPDYDKYNEAVIDYKFAVREEQRKQEEQVRKQQEEQERQKNRQLEIDRSFYAKVSKVVEKLPDYNEVMQSANIDMPNSVLEAIKESELGPEIAYHLGKNPGEAERISQLSKSSPLAAVREIGKIEAKLSIAPPPTQKQTKQVTLAPEPIKPVGGTGSTAKKSLEEIPIEEYMRIRDSETFVKIGNRVRPKR